MDRRLEVQKGPLYSFAAPVEVVAEIQRCHLERFDAPALTVPCEGGVRVYFALEAEAIEMAIMFEEPAHVDLELNCAQHWLFLPAELHGTVLEIVRLKLIALPEMISWFDGIVVFFETAAQRGLMMGALRNTGSID